MEIVDLGGGRYRVMQPARGEIVDQGPNNPKLLAFVEVIPDGRSPSKWSFELVAQGRNAVIGTTRFYRQVWHRWGINLPVWFCYEQNGERATRTPAAEVEYLWNKKLLRRAKFKVGDIVFKDIREFRITKREVIKGFVHYTGKQLKDGRVLRHTPMKLGVGQHFRKKPPAQSQAPQSNPDARMST